MRISDWSSDVCSSDLRVDFLQLRRGEVCDRIALVFDDFVGRAQLFEEPEDALRARIIEVVNLDHHAFPFVFGDGRYFLMKVAMLAIALSPSGRRSEARRVGKECVSTCSSWWSPLH